MTVTANGARSNCSNSLAFEGTFESGQHPAKSGQRHKRGTWAEIPTVMKAKLPAALDRGLKDVVKPLAPDLDDCALSNWTTRDERSLADWLIKTRGVRADLPVTSDSVEILREIREVRFS